MKGKQGSRPYRRYVVYKVFHKKENRYFAVLVSSEHRTTIAWAKYVLEVSLGRKLKVGYQAHHRDENTLNDSISNLEEREGKEHHKLHNAERTRKWVLLDCPGCGKEFLREYRQTHFCKGGIATHCSRTCGGRKSILKGSQVIKKVIYRKFPG